MPVNDANTTFSDDYQLLNMKIGYELTKIKNVIMKFELGANNITNTKYASQIQVNAASFGGNAPRYYYPGNPINFYGGIQLKYIIL